MAAAGERRARGLLSLAAGAASVATRPPAMVWRSPIAAPFRSRTTDTATELERGGRELAARARERSRRVAANLLGQVLDQLAETGAVDDLVARLLASGAFDGVVAVVINHPATEEWVTGLLDEPGLTRLIDRIMESRFVDEFVARLLESEEFQVILDYVTRSPELRAALARQTAGLAGDFAVGVRSRTVVADAAAERVARSLVRRRRRPDNSD